MKSNLAFFRTIDEMLLVSILKTLSQRSDVVVVGSGLAGICAAVSAAREGSTVRLIEARSCLGGRIGKEIQFAYDFQGTTNFAYQRETGLLDEIKTAIYKENREGNYCGQERALTSWIIKEDRLELFLETQLFEVKKNTAGDKIESIIAISNGHGGRIIFRAPYFIDCSGTGVLSQLAKAPGENGLDQSEYEKSSASSIPVTFRAAASMQIVISDSPISFEPPSWVSLRWEDNHQSAKLDLLESLSKQIQGVHNVEWLGKAKNELKINSADLIWSAWDYLKNRSPLAERAQNWILRDFSPLALSSQGFRATGDYILTPEDMESATKFYDSVALGRAPLDVVDSLLCSPRGKIALPQPFEIPLRSLYSNKIKNLFFAGEHASATSRASASFSHPPTSAQMGEAVGVCAAFCLAQKRLPRTISKIDNVDALRQRLTSLNHTCSLSSVEDLDNLIPDSKAIPSTTLGGFVRKCPAEKPSFYQREGLIQFPVVSASIDEIYLYLEAEQDCQVEFRLLECSSSISTIPGSCLASCLQEIKAGGPRWEKISLNGQVNRKGWHFIEFTNNEKVIFYEQKNAPVGLLFHQSIQASKSGFLNPYSEYLPKLSRSPGLSSSIALEVSPHQKVYDVKNVQNDKTRPDHLPNLWISEETDFRFPEYLEFHWEQPVDLSAIEIVWDSTLEFLFPSRPLSFTQAIAPSIVKDYKIYFMNEVGHWEYLIEVIENQLGFSHHSFETVKTRAIEIEILKTHGLNRAQVFQVRAYS